MQWQGRNIDKLNSLELVQAYQICLAQEERRERASQHNKFTKDRIDPITKKETKKMEFPPPNPYFLEVKAALLKEINNRNIKLENDNVEK